VGTYEDALKRAIERGDTALPEELWGADRLKQVGVSGVTPEPDVYDAYNMFVDRDAPYSYNVKKGQRPSRVKAPLEGPPLPEMGPEIPGAERFVRGSELAAGKVSGLMGKALKFLGHPAVVAGTFLPDGVKILRGLTRAAREAHEQDIYVNQMLEVEVEERRRRRERYANERRRSMLRDENARRLAMYAPHLFNQVMAGRKLPRDAVVVGGQPRVDLLDELAQGMADGEWGDQ